MRNKENYNAYQREYQKNRYSLRRNNALEALGGKCKVCGSKENLELDHINRDEKSFNISRLWSIAEEDYNKELAKCQVLCNGCHEKKTREDLGQVSAKDTHGTISSSRYCKCALCREAKNAYSRVYKREWRKRKKLGCEA